MQSVLERNAWLARVEELERRREYTEIIRICSSLPDEFGRDVPELMYSLGLSLRRLGRFHEALTVVEAMAPDAPRWRHTALYRHHRTELGMLLVEFGRLREAEEVLLEVLSESAASDDQATIGAVSNALGVIAQIRRDWHQAIAAIERAMAAAVRLGMTRVLGSCHHNLGMAYRDLGLLSDADNQFEHALDQFRAYGTFIEVLSAQSERALLIHLQGDDRRAESHACKALVGARDQSDKMMEGEVLRVLGIIRASMGLRSDARDCFSGSLRFAIETKALLLQAEVNEELAVLEAVEGKPDLAFNKAAEAARLYDEMGATVRGRLVYSRLEAVDRSG